MIQLVEKNKPQIFSICREFGIRNLDLFGSAATGNFDLERSDLDLVFDSEMKNPYFKSAVNETREPLYSATLGIQ